MYVNNLLNSDYAVSDDVLAPFFPRRRNIFQTRLICASVCFLHQLCSRAVPECSRKAYQVFFSTPTQSLFIHETIATTQIHLSLQISGPVIVTSTEHKLYSRSGGSSCGGPILFYTGRETKKSSSPTRYLILLPFKAHHPLWFIHQDVALQFGSTNGRKAELRGWFREPKAEAVTPT